MCRHLAYLGPPASLRSLLIDPPHSLYRQAWAPRLQRHGTVNADGFGIGWYAGSDPVPARYRRGEPIWGDPSLPDIARVTRSGAVLAAVRSATPGTAEPLTLLSCLEALVDSALLWALALQRLRAGLPLDAALAGTIGAVEAAGGTGRLNLLLTDGESIAATAYGDTLWYRLTAPDGAGGAAAVTVTSEPDDDGPGWTEVPDRHVLTATPSRVRVRPLSDLSGAPPSGRPHPQAAPHPRAASHQPATHR